MSLSRRLGRLEALRSEAGECTECGLSPGAPLVDYEVLWDDARDAEPVEPEFCGTCGRQTSFVVRVVYGDAEGGGGTT